MPSAITPTTATTNNPISMNDMGKGRRGLRYHVSATRTVMPAHFAKKRQKTFRAKPGGRLLSYASRVSLLNKMPPLFLQPGRNCWRIAPADRLAFLLDGESCFRAVREAILQARHSVGIL